MNVQTAEYLFVACWLFVAGTVVGSLLNVCIHRLAREESFWKALSGLASPPSHCPRCKEPIPFYLNVPILGWCLLRGRCRNCRGKISIRYLLVELLTGALFVGLYLAEIPDWSVAGLAGGSLYHPYGPSSTTGPTLCGPVMLVHLRYALHLALLSALTVATFIDFDRRIIPDAVTLPAMILAIAAQTQFGHLYIVPLWYQTPAMAAFSAEISERILGADAVWSGAWGVPAWMINSPHLHGLLVSLAGVLVGGGTVWGVRVIGRVVLNREAMGFGDVVLLAMIGGFVGWQASLVIFFLAPLCALLVVLLGWLFRRDREIPFGPYLSAAAVLLLTCWKTIWPWFESHLFALGVWLPVAALAGFALLAGLLMLTRVVQRMMGIEHHEPLQESEWNAGDQLAYLAGECADDRQGQWPRPDWPGRLSGRGLLGENRWRRR